MPKDYEKEIAQREREIAELRREKEAFDQMPPDARLAATLHEALCNWNHTDGCGWFYEVHKGVDDWQGSSHERWLQHVRKLRTLLPDMDDATIIKVTRAIKGIG